MADDEATTEAGAEVLPVEAAGKEAAESLGFLKAAKRDLEAGEIPNAITVRFMIEKVEDLQRELTRLRPRAEKASDLQAQIHVLGNRSKLQRAQEFTADALLVLSGAGMGVSANYFDQHFISFPAFAISLGVGLAAMYLKVKSS